MGTDIKVTTPNENDFIIFTSTNTPIRVSGLESLIQIVTKTLLTIPGRDVIAPDYGGGLTAVLTANVDPSKIESIKADVGVAVLKTIEDIKNEQDRGIDTLQPEERLRDLALEALDFDISSGTWSMSIGVFSEAGNSASVGLEIGI